MAAVTEILPVPRPLPGPVPRGATRAALPPGWDDSRLPLLPWRDPHSVSPAELAGYIRMFEAACSEQPQSAGLRTCLGVLYAMNFEVYKSMDALEAAVALDPSHFFAQLKYAELLYRLRALPRAEEETLKALELAGNGWQLALSQRQLQEVRKLMREGILRPVGTKPLALPAFLLAAASLVLSLLVTWK